MKYEILASHNIQHCATINAMTNTITTNQVRSMLERRVKMALAMKCSVDTIKHLGDLYNSAIKTHLFALSLTQPLNTDPRDRARWDDFYDQFERNAQYAGIDKAVEAFHEFIEPETLQALVYEWNKGYDEPEYAFDLNRYLNG